MAFCMKCGAQLEEGAKFCTACATPVDETAPAGETTPVGEAAPAGAPAPAAKPLNTKMIGIIAGAVAALVLVIVLIVALSSGGGYSTPEDAAEAFVEAYYTGDVDTVFDCYPEFYQESLADDLGCDVDDLKDVMDELLGERLEDMEIEDFEIKKVKVDDDGDDLDDIPGWIEDAMSKSDKSAFEEWAEVEVEFEIDGDERTMYITCICLDGVWYTLD